jgi:hypothetical protein
VSIISRLKYGCVDARLRPQTRRHLENRLTQRPPRTGAPRIVQSLPPIILLAAAVMAGLLLGRNLLRGTTNRPVLVGLHLILGAAGLESTAMLLREDSGRPLGFGSSLGGLAAGFLVLALMSGLSGPMIRRRWPQRAGKILLILHASAGAAGLCVVLAWRLPA